MKTIEIIYVKGPVGNSLYIDNFRVAGPKPWAGGQVISKWQIPLKDILSALPKCKDESNK